MPLSNRRMLTANRSLCQTMPRPREGADGSVVTVANSGPSLVASTGALFLSAGSGVVDLFEHRVEELGTDDRAELGIHAMSLHAVGGAINVDEGEPLLLEERGCLDGLVRHCLAPVGSHLDGGSV